MVISYLSLHHHVVQIQKEDQCIPIIKFKLYYIIYIYIYKKKKQLGIIIPRNRISNAITKLYRKLLKDLILY